jgi:transposase
VFVLKTLLNRIEPMKGFVYESSRINSAAGTQRGSLSGCVPSIEIGLRIRASAPSSCTLLALAVSVSEPDWRKDC